MNDRNEVPNWHTDGIPLLYLSLITLLASFSWLLPNHNHPWTSFHSEAWISLIFGIVAIWIFLLSPSKIAIPGLALLFLATACLPLVQHLYGMIYSSGDAWLQSIYLAGFATTLILGHKWQVLAPGQACRFLFSAFIIAGVTSVAIVLLQINQYSGFWIVPLINGRAYANLSQPNHLASLLLLALIGVFWWYREGKLHPFLGIGIALILLSGLALTQSRTGWLNAAIITMLLLIAPQEPRASRWRITLLLLALFFLLAASFSPTLIAIFSGITPDGRNFSDPTRLALWRSALEAIETRPWFGWGWGKAYTALAAGHFTSTGGVARQSHNIVLDLMIYNGIPVGFTIAGVFLAWLARNISRSLKSANEHLPPLMALLILSIHAMVELPLHYTYFLFPFGLLAGVVSGSKQSQKIALHKTVLCVIAIGLLGALFLIASDYFEVEQNFRRSSYPVGDSQPYHPQKMHILTQWEDQLWFANTPPAPIKDKNELERIENIVISGPAPMLQMKLAHHLVLGNDHQGANKWLDQLCKSMQPAASAALFNYWRTLGEKDSRFLSISPDSCREAESRTHTSPLPASAS